MEGVPQLQPQQGHQALCLLHVSDVNSSVWGRNAARDTARHNEVEDLPHETPLRYSGKYSVDMRRNADNLKKEHMRQKQLHWFGHVQRMPDDCPQKQLLEFRLKGKKRPQGGAPLRWIVVVSKHLAELTNWQVVVKN